MKKKRRKAGREAWRHRRKSERQRLAAIARAERRRRAIIAAAQRILDATGVSSRVEAVRRAVRDQSFDARLRAALSPDAKSLEDVRATTARVLADQGIDTADVLLTFSWDGRGELGIFVRAGIAAVDAAMAEAAQKLGADANAPTLGL